MTRQHKTPCLILTTLVAWLSYAAVATAQLPYVHGTIFNDLNLNGQTDVGEELSGVALTLYADDGDMLFDIGLDAMVGTMSTGSAGQYGFDNLDVSKNYFVYQGSQIVGSLNLMSSVSGLLDPLVDTLLVDAFDSQQRVEGNPIFPVGANNLTSSVLGGQRDLRVDYLSGPAEVVLHANPWGLNHVLQLDQSAGSTGTATVTWDGLDNDMSTTPASNGLGGIDLTADGGEAFAFLAGIDEAGAGELLTLRIFSGDDESIASILMPVTNGTATSDVIVPFSIFSGAASFASVDAIQVQLGGTNPSVDAQLGPITVVTGATADMSVVAIPEPSAGLMAAISCLLLSSRRKRRCA